MAVGRAVGQSGLVGKRAGKETEAVASGVSAIVVVVSSIPATIWADKWGRRTSTLVGGVGLSITMIIMGAIYAGNQVRRDSGVGRWIVIVCLYIYCVTFATTWAISVKVWAPEVQPQHRRAQAMSLVVVFNWIGNWFVTFICPVLLSKSAPSACFLFGGCTAARTIISFLYMVETKGRSLDEIEGAFKKKRRPVSSAVLENREHGSEEIKTA